MKSKIVKLKYFVKYLNKLSTNREFYNEIENNDIKLILKLIDIVNIELEFKFYAYWLLSNAIMK